jgi:hypothetical protein
MERTEAIGIGASVAGHAGLFVVMAFLAINATREAVPPAAMEVSYVDEVGLTSTSPNPTPAAAPPAAQEEGPVEQAAPAPSPVAAPAPALSAAPALEQARPRPAPQGGSGAAERSSGSRLNLDPASFGTDPRRRPDGPAASYGPAQRASVRQAIARALARCQRQTLPAPEAAAIRVEYRVTLNPDGSLASAQFLRVINGDPSLERYEGRMRDIALNVINACTPIRGLPAEYYEVPGGWRQFPYQFDPRTVR